MDIGIHSRFDEDNQWIEYYVKNKDAETLGKLYEKYKKQIYIHCLKLMKNTEEAKDMTSDTFIKAFEKIHTFRLGSPFYPWLSRIASNLCIDQLRKRSRYQYEDIEQTYAVSYSEETMEEREYQNELKHKIQVTIEKLKTEQKRCFSLFYIYHLSYEEITERTGFPYNEVRSHIQNGRRRFKILMEQS